MQASSERSIYIASPSICPEYIPEDQTNGDHFSTVFYHGQNEATIEQDPDERLSEVYRNSEKD